MNILYQSDDNYAVYMGVSICSLLENNKNVDEINIFIIDDAISEDNKNKLQSMVLEYKRNIMFLNTDKVLREQAIVEAFEYVGMRKNTHSYLKMFLDILLPEFIDRIIYIDCDTAVTGDLQELFSCDMNGKTVGMVMDSLVIKSKCSIGFGNEDKYYNSGIILVDLNAWKKRECSKRIFNHVKNIRTYGTIDQDVLNVELKNEILTLPIEYNLQPIHLEYSYAIYTSIFKHGCKYYSESEIIGAVKNPKIIHYLRYIGESPWHIGNVHPGAIYFDKYLKRTPWKNLQKKCSNRGKILKLEKWMYLHLPKKIFLFIFYIVHERMIFNSNKIKSRGKK